MGGSLLFACYREMFIKNQGCRAKKGGPAGGNFTNQCQGLSEGWHLGRNDPRWGRCTKSALIKWVSKPLPQRLFKIKPKSSTGCAPTWRRKFSMFMSEHLSGTFSMRRQPAAAVGFTRAIRIFPKRGPTQIVNIPRKVPPLALPPTLKRNIPHSVPSLVVGLEHPSEHVPLFTESPDNKPCNHHSRFQVYFFLLDWYGADRSDRWCPSCLSILAAADEAGGGDCLLPAGSLLVAVIAGFTGRKEMPLLTQSGNLFQRGPESKAIAGQGSCTEGGCLGHGWTVNWNLADIGLQLHQQVAD